MRCIVLDAMGVIFQAADDVAELLIPFIADHGGIHDASAVESLYHDASLGMIGPDEFWLRVGLDSSREDAYLARHALTPGVDGFLQCAGKMRVPVWCLSNDIERWSTKLRANLGLGQYLAGAVISSAVGARKPDAAIYRHLIEQTGYRPDELLFFDDRAKNVDGAKAVGMPAKLFDASVDFSDLQRQLLQGIQLSSDA